MKIEVEVDVIPKSCTECPMMAYTKKEYYSQPPIGQLTFVSKSVIEVAYCTIGRFDIRVPIRFGDESNGCKANKKSD